MSRRTVDTPSSPINWNKLGTILGVAVILGGWTWTAAGFYFTAEQIHGEHSEQLHLLKDLMQRTEDERIFNSLHSRRESLEGWEQSQYCDLLMKLRKVSCEI